MDWGGYWLYAFVVCLGIEGKILAERERECALTQPAHVHPLICAEISQMLI